MRNNLDGWTIKIYFEDSDEEYTAFIEEYPSISAGGETIEKAIQQLSEAWDLALEDMKEAGEPNPIPPRKKHYSGNIALRIGPDLHRKLAITSTQKGLSMNMYVTQILAENIVG